jgi:hypothetical protein
VASSAAPSVLCGGGAGANGRLVDQLAADGSTRRHRRRARAVTQAFQPVAQARWRMPAVAATGLDGPGRASPDGHPSRHRPCPLRRGPCGRGTCPREPETLMASGAWSPISFVSCLIPIAPFARLRPALRGAARFPAFSFLEFFLGRRCCLCWLLSWSCVCRYAYRQTAARRALGACSPLLALVLNSASSLAASTAVTWSLTLLGAPAAAGAIA